ncbi:MAG: hypothetical protein U0941_00785 [Planctomycetaceae bacterium]
MYLKLWGLLDNPDVPTSNLSAGLESSFHVLAEAFSLSKKGQSQAIGARSRTFFITPDLSTK